MTLSEHPVTISKCDGILAHSDIGEVYVNGVLGTGERCWITVNINVGPTQHDAFTDLQTWNEDSLREFRPNTSGLYDLQLTIDGTPADLEFGRGNGGGIDDETQSVHWTQCLFFGLAPAQNAAVLRLNWDALGLSGQHQIDLRHVARSVEVGAY